MKEEKKKPLFVVLHFGVEYINIEMYVINENDEVVNTQTQTYKRDMCVPDSKNLEVILKMCDFLSENKKCCTYMPIEEIKEKIINGEKFTFAGTSTNKILDVYDNLLDPPVFSIVNM